MANLVGEGDLAEVALLVEDAWQRRGLGTALLRRLSALAARVGYAALVAYTSADNAPDAAHAAPAGATRHRSSGTAAW